MLTDIRSRLHATVPGMTEVMSDGIEFGENLVHFAGWKKHVSLYPVPEPDEPLEAEMSPYLAGKGTLKFPLGSRFPTACWSASSRRCSPLAPAPLLVFPRTGPRLRTVGSRRRATAASGETRWLT